MFKRLGTLNQINKLDASLHRVTSKQNKQILFVLFKDADLNITRCLYGKNTPRYYDSSGKLQAHCYRYLKSLNYCLRIDSGCLKGNFHKAKIHSDIFDITSHHKSMWVKLQIFLRPEAECFLVAQVLPSSILSVVF